MMILHEVKIVVILCHIFGQSLLSYCVFIAQMSNVKLISRGFKFVLRNLQAKTDAMDNKSVIL